MINLSKLLDQNKIEYKLNEPMKNHTTFKIGGNADVFISPKNDKECLQAIKICKEHNIPYFVIGKGSNLLINDEGIRGAVICISKDMSDINLISDDTIYCKSGASLISVCNFALENSLSGLEFAYGIPGNVGGAVYMNAGAYGGEIKDIIVSCEYIDQNGKIKSISTDKMDLSYRHSFFTDKSLCITSATFKLEKSDKQEIKSKMNDFIFRRKDKQPLEYPSAGSTFKRPEGSYASLLIDECGLKGYSVGGAEISKKHAGFVINKSSATCNDVLKLINDVKQIVLEKTGYILEPEIKIL